MKTLKKAIAFLTVLLMLTLCFLSCGEISTETSDVSETASSAAEKSSDESSEEPLVIEDSVPKDLKFDGETITILVREGERFIMEFGTEEIETSTLNEILIERTQNVEERLGIKIKTLVQQTDSGSYAPVNFNQKVINSLISGDPGYDIISSYAYYGVLLGNGEYLLNLHDIPYLDFEKPWWNRDYINEMTVNDKLYFITGDACYTSIDCTFATFYNKNLAQRLYPGVNLYETVDNDDWTLDFFRTLIKDTYEDLDEDGLRSDGDFYGSYIPTASEPLDAFFFGSNCKITSKNAEGLPELSFYSEKTVNFFDKMYELLFETNGVMAGQYTGESIDFAREKFMDGESVFLVSALSSSELFRDVNFLYGILPLPKMDKNQEAYYTGCADIYSILSVPYCAPEDKLPLIGAAMELLAAESYKTVVPAYFQKIMKYGYLDTDDDSRMYDLILGGITYNFGVVNSISINDIQHLVRTVLDARGKNFTSEYEAKKDAAEMYLEKLLEAYGD